MQPHLSHPPQLRSQEARKEEAESATEPDFPTLRFTSLLICIVDFTNIVEFSVEVPRFLILCFLVFVASFKIFSEDSMNKILVDLHQHQWYTSV